MRDKRVSINPVFLMIGFSLLYSIMPIVSIGVSTSLSTYSYMLLVVCLLLAIIFAKGFSTLNIYFSKLSPFIFYGILTFFIRTDSIIMWGYKLLLFVFPVIIGYYILRYARSNISKFSRILVVALIITTITTSIGVVLYPSAARYLATVKSTNDPLNILYSWRNIGGYNFVYSIVLVYPLLILAYKKKVISCFMMVCSALGIFVMLILTEYTTALLLFLISSVFIFFRRDITAKSVVITLIFGVLVVFIFNGFFSKLSLGLATRITSLSISERLIAISGGVAGVEASGDNRIAIYKRSLETFFNHPLVGTFLGKYDKTGGHSAILDAMGRFGLLGLVSVISMYRMIYRFFYQPYRGVEGFGFYFWVFCQAIILSIINTGFWFDILALYAPILFCAMNCEVSVQ